MDGTLYETLDLVFVDGPVSEQEIDGTVFDEIAEANNV